MMELTVGEANEALQSVHELGIQALEAIGLLHAVVTHSPLLTVGMILLVAGVGLFILRGLISLAMYVALVGSFGLLSVGIATALL